MKKRIAAMVLLLVMVAGLLPSVAFAAEEEKTKVAVILIDGQSNAAGRAGTLDGVDPVVPEEGDGYIWSGEQLRDLNTYVSDMVEKDKNAGKNTSVGFYPSLAKEWYEKTGEKAVIIHKGYNGSNILGWADYNGKLTSRTTGVAEDIEACIKAIEAEGTMEIASVGYYWLQGESDACPNSVAGAEAYCIYSSAEEYYAAFMAMHNAYVAALETSGKDAYCGILAVRTREALKAGYNGPDEYCGVRVAQQDLANQNADIYMASVLTEDWTYAGNKGMFSTSGGPIHYSQAGYNALGVDAAANMAAALNGTAVVESIKLFGEDGRTIYQPGSVIYVEDNARKIGDQNTSETGAAQLVAQPQAVAAFCSGVTMTLTDAKGETVTGIIDNNGYIADMSKITERLTLTVTAGTVTQTYTLTSLSAGLVGDVNCDGSVDDVDAGVLVRYLAKWSGYEKKIRSMTLADIDGSGEVDDVDAAILVRYLAGWGGKYDKYFQ